MTTDKRFWYGLIALALVVGGAWIGASRLPGLKGTAGDAGTGTAPRTGFQAPDFALPTLSGDTTIRLSDLRGHPVLINFWASWCGPCRVEMPLIQAAHEAHAGDGLVVLAVNQMESPPTVSRFVDDLGLTFAIPMDLIGDASARYQARALPASFFVDADGIIRDTFMGPMSSGLLESKLQGILEEKQPGSGQ